MSILNDAIKCLDKDGSGVHARISSIDPAADLGFVVGAHKRRSTSLALALAVVVAGAVIYFMLQAPRPPAPAAVSVASVISPPVTVPVPAAAQATAVTPTHAEDEQQEVISPPATVPVPAAAQATAVTPTHAEDEQQEVISPPSWYEAGWDAAHSGKWPEAFTSWEDGLRGLPKDRMVIVSNSYTDLARFSSVLDSYVKMFPTIGVRQRHYNGQTMYRLLIFPYHGGTREVFPKVQALFPRAGLVNASHIQINGR